MTTPTDPGSAYLDTVALAARQAAEPGAAALRQVPVLTGERDAARQQAAALQARHAADLDRIAALEARVRELEGRLRPPLIVGLNTTDWTAAGVQKHRALVGGLPLRDVRVFWKPGVNPTWSDYRLAWLTAADTPWFSAKTLTEAALRAFLDAMPARWRVPGVVYNFTYQHEGEAEMLLSADPAGAVRNYLDTNAMMQRVFAGHPNGQYFQPWKILLRHTQVEDPRPGFAHSWPRFVGDQNIPVGMDCYWPGWVKTYWPPDVLLGELLTIGEQTGLRIAVPELGGVTHYTSDTGVVGRQDTGGAARSVAIANTLKFIREQTAIESVAWWCGTGSHGDHHLDPFPGNVTAWLEGMRRNP